MLDLWCSNHQCLMAPESMEKGSAGGRAGARLVLGRVNCKGQNLIGESRKGVSMELKDDIQPGAWQCGIMSYRLLLRKVCIRTGPLN